MRSGATAYRWLLRLGGFVGMTYLLVVDKHPDPTLVFAMLGMMGLPTFWDMDSVRRRDKDGQ